MPMVIDHPRETHDINLCTFDNWLFQHELFLIFGINTYLNYKNCQINRATLCNRKREKISENMSCRITCCTANRYWYKDTVELGSVDIMCFGQKRIHCFVWLGNDRLMQYTMV